MKTGSAIALLSTAILCTSTALAATVEYFDQSAFASNAAPLTIFGFDNFADGTSLNGNEFPEFSIAARRIFVVAPQDVGTTALNVNSQPYGISASFPTFDNGDDNFDFTLTAPARAVGLWIGHMGANVSDPNPTTVTILDTQGAIIADEPLTQFHTGVIKSDHNNRIFFGVVSDRLISRVQVRNGPRDSDGIFVDDFQFAPATPRLDLIASIRVSFVDICWAGLTNKTYQVQYSSKLTTNTWMTFGTPVQGNGTNCVTDSVRGIEHRFYRVVDAQ